MRGKLVGLLVSITVIAGCLPMMVSAKIIDDGYCGDNVIWMFDDDGTLIISGTGDMANYTSGYGDHRPSYASYKQRIKSIVIENGVTSIGEYAFDKCGSLTNITIPDSITSIGECAFDGCSSLTNVTIPGNVTDIGEFAFSDCSSLTSVIISEGVTCTGNRTFSGCDSLKSVTIPDSVTSIGDNVFAYCRGLESITIPDSVTSIGSLAFIGCDSLKSITIPDGVTSIGVAAFKDCINLIIVAIHDSITSIGGSAFENCIRLNDVYYSGTEAMWNAIDVSGKNACLTYATIHYNSIEPEPVPAYFTIVYSGGYASIINSGSEEYTATVITADYSNGVLANLNAEEKTFSADESYQIAVNANRKIFVWYSLRGMKPIVSQ